MGWFRKRHSGQESEDGLLGEIETVERVLRRCSAGTSIVFGAPTRCPDCGDYGFIDRVDPRAARVDNRCLTCGALWVITRRALAARTRPEIMAALKGVAASVPEWPRRRAPLSDDELRLLLVEDDPADAELVRTVFAPFEPNGVSLCHAETRSEGERLVSASPDIDLVLLDLGLPDSSGLTTLSRWNPGRPSPPLVVLSGNDNAGLVEASRYFGAALYVHKRQLVDLAVDRQSAVELVAALREVSLTGAAR
ncbi:MAG: response regulator [Acidimicrobiales bacterium]|nr:response regulator [Acidimicrobiales bacterium]